jgi:predicted acetylornithine/succinylornithine family transaminase
LNIQEVESKFTSGLYVKRPIAIVRGKGAHVWDDRGREYIDCAGGQGTANVGHGNEAVAEAIAEQARKIISLTEVFYNDKRAAIEEKLIAISPNRANRVYLCNSGTEAIEAAIKFARYSTRRTGIVAMMRGFHGRTMGALSATWDPHYREPFLPLVPDFSHVPFENLAKAREAITDKTAGVIVEIVQGEGGVRPGSKDFLTGLEALCRERGAMFIIDEIQTGFGRTGKMFASEHYRLEGDLVCLAKSIAGGLPMGAVLMNERVKKLEPMIHGSTFGGNPLACAAAVAAIDFMEKENLSGRAAELGEYMMGRLQRIESPLIREVRGMGLLIGIELKQKVTPFLMALLERGVLALPAGPNVLRLLPPLVIQKSDLDIVADQIEQALTTKESSLDTEKIDAGE